MKLKNFLPILYVLLFSALAFLLHSFAFARLADGKNSANWHSPLSEIYVFFTVCSLLIVTVFIVVSQKNIDNAGNSFVLLTLLKIGVAFGCFYDLLTSNNPDNSEKINFFIVFAVFLTIETVISVRILNNKQ